MVSSHRLEVDPISDCTANSYRLAIVPKIRADSCSDKFHQGKGCFYILRTDYGKRFHYVCLSCMFDKSARHVSLSI